MASSSRPNRRPSVGSRTPTSRPRKVAGRTQGPSSEPPAEDLAEPEPEPEPVLDVESEPDPDPEPDVEFETEEPEGQEPEGEEPEGEEPEPEKSAPAPAPSRRLTPILVASLIALALILSGEAYYLFGPPSNDPIVSTARPVVASDVERSSAVETAAESIQKIVARSSETYDQQVEEATATMTEAFAAEYRKTTGEIKESFVAAETEVTVTVVAQSVMTASPEQADVLLFLNQFVTKDGGEALYSPYRAVATMVNTDQGWLVSDLKTR